jgi:hypothetical protein
VTSLPDGTTPPAGTGGLADSGGLGTAAFAAVGGALLAVGVLVVATSRRRNDL